MINVNNFIPLIIFLFSFQLATKPIAEIEINLETGFVYAKDKVFEYEGYSHEPEKFLVLEKIIDQNSEIPKFTDFIHSPDIYIPILAFFGLILVTIFLRKIFYK